MTMMRPARGDRRGAVPPAEQVGCRDAELVPEAPQVGVVVGVVAVPPRPVGHAEQHPAPLVRTALAAKLRNRARGGVLVLVLIVCV